MKKTLFRILTLSLLLAIAAGCISRPGQGRSTATSRAATAVPPGIPTAVPPSSPTAPVVPFPTQTAARRDSPTTASPIAPLAQVQPSPAFNLILGRPTASSVTVSILSAAAQQVTLSYASAGGAARQVGPIALQAGAPQNVTLTQLNPDTAYTYKILGGPDPALVHSFHTQRPPGASFTFTIEADPHNRDPGFSGDLYAVTLNNALRDRPDFNIDLGDTFMTEKVKASTYAEAQTTFLDMRPYFGILGADAPLFLVNGNHEGELGWLLPRGSEPSLPIWSAQLRRLYYPNPIPDDFYSGATVPDPRLGSPRDSYFAWTWGDALFVVLDPYWYTTTKPRPGDPIANWGWTLGREQYDWLRRTLQTSRAKFKFVFIHHLVGGSDVEARGGIEAAPYFEWGGKNADGSYGFDARRPGWGQPIHRLLVENHVSAVFHGHDHVFVRQELDGIIYQELPQPSNTGYDKNARLAADYGYTHGEIVASSGHLRVTVSPTQALVEYVRAYLPKDENKQAVNGVVSFKYIIKPFNT